MYPPVRQAKPFCIVIDTSMTMRKIIETELRRSQYPCIAFADPLDALQAIALQRIPVPEIALVCWRLPHLDGIQVLKHMKEAHYHTSCVLLLDEDQGIVPHIKSRLAGAQRTLVKPFTMKQLLACLASLTVTY